jgi:hypothetical protein
MGLWDQEEQLLLQWGMRTPLPLHQLLGFDLHDQTGVATPMSMHGRRLCGKRMISCLRIDPIPLLTRSLLKLSQQGSLSQWDGAMEGRSQGMIGRLIISFLKCFVIDLHELIIQLLIALGWRHRNNSFGVLRDNEKGRRRSSKWPVIKLDKSPLMTYHDTHQ